MLIVTVLFMLSMEHASSRRAYVGVPAREYTILRGVVLRQPVTKRAVISYFDRDYYRTQKPRYQTATYLVFKRIAFCIFKT